MYKIALLLISISLIGCHTNTNKREAEDRENVNSSSKADSLDYKMTYFKRISPYFQMHDNVVDTTYYQAYYPTFKDDYINSIITKSILYDGEKSLEESSENFLLGYQEFVEDNDNNYAKNTWFKDVKVNIHVNRSKVLTFSNFTYEYTGGAHGNYYTLFTNYDPITQQEIKLDSIIHSSKKTDFKRIAEKYFRKIEQLEDTATYGNKYFFENNEFQLSDNFAFLKDSLLLYYNIYEIKAYSEGPTEIKIPYDTIKMLLNVKGLQYIQSIKN